MPTNKVSYANSLSINAQFFNLWWLAHFVFHHSIIVLCAVLWLAIVVRYFWARNIINFSLRSLSGLSLSNIILDEFIKYNITVVCQLMPILSNKDDCQTFVFHYSIIVPRTIVGAAITVHYFRASSTWHFFKIISHKKVNKV